MAESEYVANDDAGDEALVVEVTAAPADFANGPPPGAATSRSASASMSWSPAKVPNIYGHVGPRYLDKKVKEIRPNESPRRETFPTNPTFRAVVSRWATSPVKPMAPTAPPKGQSPLEQWHEVVDHRKLTQSLGFGGAQSKFAELAQRADRSQSPVSPRRLVEAMKEEKKGELHWRQTCSRKEKTFDDLLKENPKMRTQSPARKSAAASQVGEYLRSGSPIKHYTQALRRSSPKTHAEGTPGSPATASPSRSWHSGGVSHHHFDELKKKNMKLSTYTREEAHVKETRERQKAAVKPANFIPRVAKLAPVYLLPETPETAPASSASPPPAKPAKS